MALDPVAFTTGQDETLHLNPTDYFLRNSTLHVPTPLQGSETSPNTSPAAVHTEKHIREVDSLIMDLRKLRDALLSAVRSIGGTERQTQHVERETSRLLDSAREITKAATSLSRTRRAALLVPGGFVAYVTARVFRHLLFVRLRLMKVVRLLLLLSLAAIVPRALQVYRQEAARISGLHARDQAAQDVLKDMGHSTVPASQTTRQRFDRAVERVGFEPQAARLALQESCREFVSVAKAYWQMSEHVVALTQLAGPLIAQSARTSVEVAKAVRGIVNVFQRMTS